MRTKLFEIVWKHPLQAGTSEGSTVCEHQMESLQGLVPVWCGVSALGLVFFTFCSIGFMVIRNPLIEKKKLKSGAVNNTWQSMQGLDEIDRIYITAIDAFHMSSFPDFHESENKVFTYTEHFR